MVCHAVPPVRGCTVMFHDPVSFSGTCIRPDVNTSEMRMVGRYGVGPSRPEGEDNAEE